MALRKLPYHKVLHRPHLYLSGERGPVLALLFSAFLIVVACLNIPAFVLGAVLWWTGLPILQRMAKRHPQMSTIYLRHISYRPHYAARSRPSVKVKRAAVS
jgi:type IV secretory pathway TrbD component